MNDLELVAGRAGVAIIDVQERLAAAMPREVMERVERNVRVLLETARMLGLPVVVSEQYPKGLGPTLPAVAEAVAALPAGGVHRVEKLEFSCEQVPAWLDAVRGSGRTQWVLCGMECHVCVYQTARGLLARGLSAHVPRDAVVSRARENWETGLALMERAGAVVTSTETVAFDLVKRAGNDAFRAVSRLVR